MTHFKDVQAALPFVVAQGRNIETQIYTRKYPAFNYAEDIPVVTEGNQWAIGTTFFTVDSAGEAKFLSGAGTDMPFNQVNRDQASHDFALIGSGWEWNLEEVNQASLYGLNLNATKAMSAADKIERLLNNIAYLGSEEKNWTGLLNDPAVARFDAAATGTGNSRLWADKTDQQIANDLNALIGSVQENTNEVEWADTVLLPPAAFRLLSTRPWGTGNGELTVIEYLRRNNEYTATTGQRLTIRPKREARFAGQGGTGRAVAYRRDREVVRFHLPMPRTVLGVHHKSIMGFETGIIARTGGTEIRLPGAVSYMDGITPAA